MMNVNAHNVIKILSNLVATNLPISRLTRIGCPRDEEVAKQLFENLVSIINSTYFYVENETSLDHTFDSDDDESDEDDTDPNEASHDDPYVLDDKEKTFHQSFSLEYMQEVVDYFDEKDPMTGKRKRKWKTVKHRFMAVPCRQYISRFRHYLATNGNKRQKLDTIDSGVYDCFEKARQERLSVHDIDLKRWALRTAKEISLTDFVASDCWLKHFKHNHQICSRKITKFVTKKEVENEELIIESANNFVSKVEAVAKRYHANNILNTDQIGIELEMHSNRTLSHAGEKTTLASVRSLYSRTHSYTVQPMISMGGKVIGPLFLCLKEPTGKLSDNIKKNLFKAKNVVVTCSTSGKLTESLVKYWRDTVLEPTMGSKKCLLLSDCWGAQGDETLYTEMKDCTRLEIPKKTTSIIQPLDVYFNRQYKAIARKVHDRIRIDELNITISDRNNIIKLNSLIHNQLCSKKFENMIRYAWFASKYLKTNPGPFHNVKQICFSHMNEQCEMKKCPDYAFIKCSHCEKTLCFNHFFILYHIH